MRSLPPTQQNVTATTGLACGGLLLSAWRASNPARADLLPDAVTDTTRRRMRRAAAALPQVRWVRREAARQGYSCRLIHGLISVPGDLYRHEDIEAALDKLKALLGGAPVWWKVEWAPSGGLHVHFVTTESLAPALAAAGIWHREIWALEGLLLYLGKPQDARACRFVYQREVDLSAAEAAAEDYLRAKRALRMTKRRKLPASTGKINVTNIARKSALLAALLRLAVAALAAALLVLEVDRRRAALAAVLTWKRAARSAMKVSGSAARPNTRAPRCRPAVGLERRPNRYECTGPPIVKPW